MQVIAPLSVESVTPALLRIYDTDIIQVALSNEIELPVSGREIRHSFGELLQEGPGTRVVDGMDRVQTECIHVVISEPVKSVLDEEVPHLVTTGVIEVESAPQGVLYFFVRGPNSLR